MIIRKIMNKKQCTFFVGGGGYVSFFITFFGNFVVVSEHRPETQGEKSAM